MPGMTPPPYAEYPRPGEGQFPGSGRGPGVYFEAIGEAWNLVRQDLGHWIAATVVYFVVAYGLGIPISLFTQSMMPARPTADQMGQVFGVFALQLVLNLIPTAITTILMVGMISMGVRKARGEYINVGMVFEPFRRFGTVFGSSLLYYVVVFVSALACLLPIFYFIPVLFLMPVVAYLKGIGPVEALSLTFDRCKGYWAGLLGLTFILGLVVGLSFCACLVGVLVGWPIYCVVMAIHYRAFFESEPVPPYVPA